MSIDKTAYKQYVEELKAQLIVPLEQIMATSALDLNIDPDKLIFACVNAQKEYLEPMIGSSLYRKLQEDNLTFEYQLLLDRFANDAIINWGVAEAIKSVGFSISNGGIYKHVASDSETATNAERSGLRQNYLNKADTFAQRLVEFLNKNSTYYPEYRKSVGDGVDATKQNMFTGGLNIEPTRAYGGATNGVNPNFISANDRAHSCSGIPRVGSSDPSIFQAETYWGNNDEVAMGFDPSTLSEESNTVPPSVFAQPTSNYFWVVSKENIKLGQAGTEIPMSSFDDTDADAQIFVAGTMNDLYWVRVKISEVYENQVQFTLTI